MYRVSRTYPPLVKPLTEICDFSAITLDRGTDPTLWVVALHNDAEAARGVTYAKVGAGEGMWPLE